MTPCEMCEMGSSIQTPFSLDPTPFTWRLLTRPGDFSVSRCMERCRHSCYRGGSCSLACTLLGRHSQAVISELSTAPTRSPANPAESGTTPSLVVGP
jgi:hypothetical protein